MELSAVECDTLDTLDRCLAALAAHDEAPRVQPLRHNLPSPAEGLQPVAASSLPVAAPNLAAPNQQSDRQQHAGPVAGELRNLSPRGQLASGPGIPELLRLFAPSTCPPATPAADPAAFPSAHSAELQRLQQQSKEQRQALAKLRWEAEQQRQELAAAEAEAAQQRQATASAQAEAAQQRQAAADAQAQAVQWRIEADKQQRRAEESRVKVLQLAQKVGRFASMLERSRPERCSAGTQTEGQEEAAVGLAPVQPQQRRQQQPQQQAASGPSAAGASAEEALLLRRRLDQAEKVMKHYAATGKEQAQKRKELEGQVRSLRRELAAAAHQQQKAGAAPSLEQPRQQQQPEGTQQTATSGAHPAAGAAAAALGEQSSRGLQLGKGELPAGSRQPRPAQEAGQHIGKGVIMQVPGLGWRKGTVDAYVPGRGYLVRFQDRMLVEAPAEDMEALLCSEGCLVGSSVMKVFEDRKKYKGEVVRYDVRTKWYRIRYVDGDEEEMDESEVLAVLQHRLPVQEATPAPSAKRSRRTPTKSQCSKKQRGGDASRRAETEAVSRGQGQKRGRPEEAECLISMRPAPSRHSMPSSPAVSTAKPAGSAFFVRPDMGLAAAEPALAVEPGAAAGRPQAAAAVTIAAAAAAAAEGRPSAAEGQAAGSLPVEQQEVEEVLGAEGRPKMKHSRTKWGYKKRPKKAAAAGAAQLQEETATTGAAGSEAAPEQAVLPSKCDTIEVLGEQQVDEWFLDAAEEASLDAPLAELVQKQKQKQRQQQQLQEAVNGLAGSAAEAQQEPPFEPPVRAEAAGDAALGAAGVAALLSQQRVGGEQQVGDEAAAAAMQLGPATGAVSGTAQQPTGAETAGTGLECRGPGSGTAAPGQPMRENSSGEDAGAGQLAEQHGSRGAGGLLHVQLAGQALNASGEQLAESGKPGALRLSGQPNAAVASIPEQPWGPELHRRQPVQDSELGGKGLPALGELLHGGGQLREAAVLCTLGSSAEGASSPAEPAMVPGGKRQQQQPPPDAGVAASLVPPAAQVGAKAAGTAAQRSSKPHYSAAPSGAGGADGTGLAGVAAPISTEWIPAAPTAAATPGTASEPAATPTVAPWVARRQVSAGGQPATAAAPASATQPPAVAGSATSAEATSALVPMQLAANWGAAAPSANPYGSASYAATAAAGASLPPVPASSWPWAGGPALHPATPAGFPPNPSYYDYAAGWGYYSQQPFGWAPAPAPLPPAPAVAEGPPYGGAVQPSAPLWPTAQSSPRADLLDELAPAKQHMLLDFARRWQACIPEEKAREVAIEEFKWMDERAIGEFLAFVGESLKGPGRTLRVRNPRGWMGTHYNTWLRERG